MDGVGQMGAVASLSQWGHPRGGEGAPVGKMGREAEEEEERTDKNRSSIGDAQNAGNGGSAPWHGAGQAELYDGPSSSFGGMEVDSDRSSTSSGGIGPDSDFGETPEMIGSGAQRSYNSNGNDNYNTFNALHSTVSAAAGGGTAASGDGLGGVHDQLIKQADELVACGCQVIYAVISVGGFRVHASSQQLYGHIWKRRFSCVFFCWKLEYLTLTGGRKGVDPLMHTQRCRISNTTRLHT